MLANSLVTPTLPAIDLKRARSFYEDKLGLKAVQSSEQDVTYQAGAGTNIYVWQREPTSATDHTETVFAVQDIEEEVKDLKAKGVKFESYDMPGLRTDENDIAASDGARAAWFKDTEGNVLGLVQM